jgi:hypothetical protein
MPESSQEQIHRRSADQAAPRETTSACSSIYEMLKRGDDRRGNVQHHEDRPLVPGRSRDPRHEQSPHRQEPLDARLVSVQGKKFGFPTSHSAHLRLACSPRRCPADVQDGRHLRRRVRARRRISIRPTTRRTRPSLHLNRSGKKVIVLRLGAHPHRAGHRVRLLLGALRVVAQGAGLRGHHRQQQPRDGLHRLRHRRPAVFRAAHPEDVMSIIDLEKPMGVVVAFGGQTAIKADQDAGEKQGVNISAPPPIPSIWPRTASASTSC